MPIRVMLADDHAVVRAGHRFLLNQEKDIVIIAETDDTDSTYQQYLVHQPDVLVLDLSLPGAGGLAVIRRIVSRDPSAKILVFTMHEELVYAKRTLEAGAYGYLTKDTDPDLLPEAIRQVAMGRNYVTEPIASQLVAQYTQGNDNPLALLTQREFEIFCLAAKGLSPHEISSHLHISYKTAANHMTRIKQKLNVSTSGELVRLAYLHGLAER